MNNRFPYSPPVLDREMLQRNLDQRFRLVGFLNLLLSVVGSTSLIWGPRSVIRGGWVALGTHVPDRYTLAVDLLGIVVLGVIFYWMGELLTRFAARWDVSHTGRALSARFVITLFMGVMPAALALEWGGMDTFSLLAGIVFMFLGSHVQLGWLLAMFFFVMFLAPLALVAWRNLGWFSKRGRACASHAAPEGGWGRLVLFEKCSPPP